MRNNNRTVGVYNRNAGKSGIPLVAHANHLAIHCNHRRKRPRSRSVRIQQVFQRRLCFRRNGLFRVLLPRRSTAYSPLIALLLSRFDWIAENHSLHALPVGALLPHLRRLLLLRILFLSFFHRSGMGL